MREIQFLQLQITPPCYTNWYLARGARLRDSSKAAVPKYDFGDVFLSITAWEGRREKLPVSVLLHPPAGGGPHPEMWKYFRVCPGQIRSVQGLRLPFGQPTAGAQGEREASLTNGSQSRKRNW